MKLPTPELRASLPPLYSQEKAPDPIVHAKFFTSDSNWTWYVTEGEADGDDFRFFGYVCGMEGEWGYFALSEARIRPRTAGTRNRARSAFSTGAIHTSHGRGAPQR